MNRVGYGAATARADVFKCRTVFLQGSLLGAALAGIWALTAPTSAQAQEPYGPSLDFYVEPKAATVIFDTNLPDDVLDTDTNAGSGVGGAIGLADPVTGLRGEAEIFYQRAGFDLGPNGDHLDALGFMANGYFDLPTGGPVTPYVGGGIGTARVGAEIDGIADDSDWVFAYNLQAGLNYDLYRGGRLTAGYRYTEFGDATIPGLVGELQTESHAIQVGYKLGF